jgi:O-antigen ligase
VGALAAGREIAHGAWVPICVTLAGTAFLVWALNRPEHAAMGLIVALPFLVYPGSFGGFSVFAGAPLAALVSITLLLGQRNTFGRLRRRLSIRAFAALFAAAAASTALSVDTSTSGSRLLYLAIFGLFAWALAASISAGRMTVRGVALAIVIGAIPAAIALIVQVVIQFAVGQAAVTNWLGDVFAVFGGQHGQALALVQRNWVPSTVNIVRGIFPFMSAPSAGQYMMVGLLAAVWLLRNGRQRRSGASSSLQVLVIVLLGAALLLTFSRQSWIGAFAGLGALALRRRPMFAIGVILLLFAVLAVTPMPGAHQTFGDYLLTASDTTSTSSSTRLGLWTQALHLIPGRWFVGVGPGLFGTLNPDPANPIYYAHNVWLDESVELGLVGGLSLVALFVLAMRSAYRRAATLGFTLLASFVVANLFDDVFFFPRNGLLLAASFAVAAAGGGERRVAPLRATVVHELAVERPADEQAPAAAYA